MADDGVHVGSVVLEQLRQPVHELDVGVAAQLAEDGGAFDRLVGERIELAEQGDATDFTHGLTPRVFDVAARRASRHRCMLSTFMTRSPASRVRAHAGASGSQAVRPSRPTRWLAPGRRAATRGTSSRAQDQLQIPGEFEADVLPHQRAQLLERRAAGQQASRSAPSASGPMTMRNLCWTSQTRAAEHGAAADARAGPAASGACARRGRAASSGRRNCCTRTGTPNCSGSHASRPSASRTCRARRPAKNSFGKSPSASRSRVRLVADADQRADLAHQPAVVGAVQADGRLRPRPGAIEEAGRSGAAACRGSACNVGSPWCSVRSRAYSVRWIGSGPFGPRKPNTRWTSRGGGRLRRARSGDRRRREGQRRLLREAHRLVARAQRVAQARLVGCALSIRRIAWNRS